MAVAEAVSSIGLEDVRLSESDLLVRIAENGPGEMDVPAVEDALALLRFLRQPGSVRDDPRALLERIHRLARREDGVGEEPVATPDLAGVFSGLRGRAPFLEAVRAAADYAWRTGRQSLVAERMVFIAAEGEARRIGRGPARLQPADDPLRGLGGRIDARWVGLPGLALSQGRFRTWSPGTARGVRDLFEGLAATLGRELGRIIEIRSWLETLDREGRARRSGSRFSDVGRMFGIEPVMSSAILASRICVTQRGALNLLRELAEAGLVREVTGRRAARIWGGAEEARAGQGGNAPSRLVQRNLREEHREDVDRALEAFDRVLTQVDEILSRTRTERSGAGS